MVSDQEIAKGLETLLRQSDPNAATSLNTVVEQLEVKLGLDLSHKVDFIRDQITFLLRAQPVSHHNNPQYILTQQLYQPCFALQQQPPQRLYQQNTAAAYPPPSSLQMHGQQQPLQVATTVVREQNATPIVSESPKERPRAGTKRKGGPGGLNKVCGVSPKLQVIVGEPALPRTEIVRQLWVYIRKHNLQDPGNKRKIICDDALRSVFETDCTDMFKMNKLLAKHILPLDPKQSEQVKKLKVEDECAKHNSESRILPVMLSDALLKFFGTGEKEMLQSEALERVWEYIKVNQLEDPLSPMFIHCDAKLQELLGCESISVLGIQKMIVCNHLMKQL